ncbi:unnamed protein product, partial [Clonostachys rosea]
MQSRQSLSCLACREAKLKCDRAFPQCGRCAKSGKDCVFPHSRQNRVGRQKHLNEIEARLADLEGQCIELRQPAALASGAEQTQPPDDTQWDQPGPISILDDPLPPDLIRGLVNTYFDKLGHMAPMIHRVRFIASLSLAPELQPLLCLQYIIMALGASLSTAHRSLDMPLYEQALSLAKSSESMVHGTPQAMLAYAQCWILFSNFEAQRSMFPKASMSLSHSIRICQMMRLHEMDEQDEESSQSTLDDIIDAESRRRTWWMVFISDRLVGAVTGLPLLIHAQDISTLLPSSEEAFLQGLKEPTTTLHSVLRQTDRELSILGTRVTTAHLVHKVFTHTSKVSRSRSPENHQSLSVQDEESYWTSHDELDGDLSLLLIRLPKAATFPDCARDQNAISINIQIHGAIMALHRAAIWSMCFTGQQPDHNQLNEQQQIYLRRCQERTFFAAGEVVHILRMTNDPVATLKNPILNFAIYLACLVFIERYLYNKCQRSQAMACYVVELLITMGKDSSVARSLAAQASKEMSIVGMSKFNGD